MCTEHAAIAPRETYQGSNPARHVYTVKLHLRSKQFLRSKQHYQIVHVSKQQPRIKQLYTADGRVG